MSIQNNELEEIINSKRKLLRIHRQRKQILEEQAAIAGLSVSPAILMELASLNDQIKSIEDEISRIATEAAVDRFSLAEAEYRVQLAEAWDTPNGIPTMASRAKLELMRLKLGINPSRAMELEREIREQLAQEVFADIDLRPLFGNINTMPLNFDSGSMTVNIQPTSEGTVTIESLNVIQQGQVYSPLETNLKALGKAIRLEYRITIKLFMLYLPPTGNSLDMSIFRSNLFQINRAEVFPRERQVFEQFIINLEAELQERSLQGNNSEDDGTPTAAG